MPSTRFEEHIEFVRTAARECGMRHDSLEGRLVSALLAAIVASGEMQAASSEHVRNSLPMRRRSAMASVDRLKVIFAGGESAIEIAKQAAETANAAGKRAEVEFDSSVAHIASQLSKRLI